MDGRDAFARVGESREGVGVVGVGSGADGPLRGVGRFDGGWSERLDRAAGAEETFTRRLRRGLGQLRGGVGPRGVGDHEQGVEEGTLRRARRPDVDGVRAAGLDAGGREDAPGARERTRDGELPPA